MNQEKNTKKRILIIIGIIVAVLLVGGLAAFGVAKVLQSIEKPANDTTGVAPAPTSKDLVEKGISAESKGETKAALESYKSARASCAEDDSACKVDMDSKINTMTAILVAEEKQKSEPVPTIPEADSTPAGATSNE